MSTTSLDHQLTLTLRLASEAVGASQGSIMLVNHETGRLEIRCSVGIAEPDTESSLCLPLVVEDRVLGVLTLSRRPPEGAQGRFTPDELRLASSLAEMASIALEKAALTARLSEREERVAGLLEAAINARELERRRIAGEMHDGFLQALTRLHLKTEVAKISVGPTCPNEAVQALDSIQQAVRETSEELRHFVFRVCPSSVDELGLAPTLKAMVDEVGTRSCLEGHFDNQAGGERLPGTVERVLYRVAQEALRNIVKHAGARRFWVSLERAAGEARLNVQDDGRGVEPEMIQEPRPGGGGLSAMEERLALLGGSVRFGPAPEGGTRLSARIPLATSRL